MSEITRTTWRHLKSNGTEYEITADLCGLHLAALEVAVLEAEPAPMRNGRKRCTFCTGTPYVRTKAIGRVM